VLRWWQQIRAAVKKAFGFTGNDDEDNDADENPKAMYAICRATELDVFSNHWWDQLVASNSTQPLPPSKRRRLSRHSGYRVIPEIKWETICQFQFDTNGWYDELVQMREDYDRRFYSYGDHSKALVPIHPRVSEMLHDYTQACIPGPLCELIAEYAQSPFETLKQSTEFLNCPLHKYHDDQFKRPVPDSTSRCECGRGWCTCECITPGASELKHQWDWPKPRARPVVDQPNTWPRWLHEMSSELPWIKGVLVLLDQKTTHSHCLVWDRSEVELMRPMVKACEPFIRTTVDHWNLSEWFQLIETASDGGFGLTIT
jgi:hypothetical protein